MNRTDAADPLIDRTVTRDDPSALYCLLPGVDDLLSQDVYVAMLRVHPREAVLRAVRDGLAQLREEIRAGRHTGQTLHELLKEFPAKVQYRLHNQTSLSPLINATGVLLHTNMGRAPLSPRALEHVSQVAGGYSNLELDLASGARGRRDRHAEPQLLRLLVKAAGPAVASVATTHASLVVNNCAAAIFLALHTLAEGGEVVVSRSELVEIGGGFRIPDILRRSGALLREVGTTNRTRVADYAEVLNPNTRLILRVHQSNFRMEGFVQRPLLEQLVELGRKSNVPVFEDQGTGFVASGAELGIQPESSLVKSFRAGPDLIAASGDKLLGGPQCGLLIGARALIEQLRSNPLYRALRVDKMTYAALEATLLDYLDGRYAEIPLLAMMQTPVAVIKTRCERMAAALDTAPMETSVVAVESVTGGGTAPGDTLASFAVSLRPTAVSAEQLAAALREQRPPIVARLQGERVLLDLRTVFPEQDSILLRLLLQWTGGKA